MESLNSEIKIKHLYARAGFGVTLENLKDQQNWSPKRAVRRLFADSEPFRPINVIEENLDLRIKPGTDEITKRIIQVQRNREERDLNISWMTLMSSAQGQLREKMTLFWHNHFSCRTGNFYYLQQLNNIHRANALGNFKRMVTEVSQSPAMLQFLNNQQNSKAHPNENFARELMELFTLGRGNYTEQDVKESARSFTGWMYDATGAFVFRDKNHDPGNKTFLGRTGSWQGQDIINMIFEKKETARFISRKLYKYLVNEQPDEAHVNGMAEVFYKAGYEIRPLLEHVFTSNWFYDSSNIGNLVKSPIELIIGLNRQFYITYQNPMVLLQFQKALGQVLFNPPNVAGWPGGLNWIDSSTLMYRLKLPSVIMNAGMIDLAGKSTPEDEAYLAAERRQRDNVIRRIQSQADIARFIRTVPPETTREHLAGFILEPPVNDRIRKQINDYHDTKTLIIRLTSTPEYQLC